MYMETVSMNTHARYAEINSQGDVYIRCIGVDDKWHVCKPDSNICLCGVLVKTKKDKDVENSKMRYSCYECTF